MTERGRGNIPAGNRTGQPNNFGRTRREFDLPGEIFFRAKEDKEEDPVYHYEVEFESDTAYESEVGQVIDPAMQGISSQGYDEAYFDTEELVCYSVAELTYTIGKYTAESPSLDVTTETISVLKNSASTTTLTVCDENGAAQNIDVYTSDQFEDKTVVTGVTISGGPYLKQDAQNGTIEIMNIAAGQPNPAGSVLTTGEDVHLFKTAGSSCSDITVLTAGDEQNNVGSFLVSADDTPTYSFLYIDSGETPEYTILVTQEDPCASEKTKTKAVLVPVDGGVDPCAPSWNLYSYLNKVEVDAADVGLTPKGNPVPVNADPLKLRIPLLEDQW